MSAFRLLSTNAKKNALMSAVLRPSMKMSNNATILSGAIHLVRRSYLATPSAAPTTRAGNDAGTKT